MIKSIAAGTIACGVVGLGAYHYLKDSNIPDTEYIIGALNMQHGPYKISRIAKDTPGLDIDKRATILTFNEYCVKKNMLDSKPNAKDLYETIFGEDGKLSDYKRELIECLVWKEKDAKICVDIGQTFKKYFDPINNQLWSSAIVDNSEQIASDIIGNNVDIMALVEASNGNENSEGEIIPHTDNLTRLVVALNENPDVDYKIASYAQFTNPVAESMPQLNRGNAIVFNTKTANLLDSFVIEVPIVKRGKKTVRRHPVCVFGQDKPTVMVCAVHICGYSYKDATEAKKRPENLKVGDKELENVLKVLSNGEAPEGSNVNIVNTNDSDLKKLLESNIPIVVLGDFNPNFKESSSIEYKHKYRFPIFEKDESETIAGKYGFDSAYNVAKKIHSTYKDGRTIDGCLIKNVVKATIVSENYNPAKATSDHSAVYVKV